MGRYYWSKKAPQGAGAEKSIMLSKMCFNFLNYGYFEPFEVLRRVVWRWISNIGTINSFLRANFEAFYPKVIYLKLFRSNFYYFALVEV